VANSINTTDSSDLEFDLSSLCAASDEQFESISDDEIALLAKKFRALHRFHKERRMYPRGCFKCGDIYPTVIIGVGRSFELSRDGRGMLRTTTGGGKRCIVERAVRGTRFICLGGAKQGTVELEEVGSDGE
jgi:hypothetical protein